MIMATTNAKRAIDSINANESILADIKSFLADGFLAMELIRDEKRFPNPIPTPANETTAMPAPINLAAPISIL